MNTSASSLFFVAVAVRPIEANPQFGKFSWALLTVWLRAVDADAAVMRAVEFLNTQPWKLCAPIAQVNLARYHAQPISADLVGLDEAIIHLDSTAPLRAIDPDFTQLFRDALTTRQLPEALITT